MSRIGKKEINIPIDTHIKIENNIIYIQGKNGGLNCSILAGILLTLKDGKLFVSFENNNKKCKAYSGLMRTLIHNMILGVNNKFLKTLVVEGVGYKFYLEKEFIILSMGYSHTIKIYIPENLEVKLDSSTKMKIFGIDKQQVGLFASKIRNVRPPEPYKGKGIRYDNEIIQRKVGKTGK